MKIGNDIQFSYKGLVEKFGMWVPISISAYRSSDTSFRKHFVSMTFETKLLPYLGYDSNGDFREFPIETFKISRLLIAHIAHVTLYDLFIVNPSGYAIHKNKINGTFSENSTISRTNIIIKTFNLF